MSVSVWQYWMATLLVATIAKHPEPVDIGRDNVSPKPPLLLAFYLLAELESAIPVEWRHVITIVLARTSCWEQRETLPWIRRSSTLAIAERKRERIQQGILWRMEHWNKMEMGYLLWKILGDHEKWIERQDLLFNPQEKNQLDDVLGCRSSTGWTAIAFQDI